MQVNNSVQKEKLATSAECMWHAGIKSNYGRAAQYGEEYSLEHCFLMFRVEYRNKSLLKPKEYTLNKIIINCNQSHL